MQAEKQNAMAKIGIFYGTSTGNTETVAEKLQKILTPQEADIYNVDHATADDLKKYPYLIFGTSTWGIGDMQDDMEDFMDILKSVDLKDKKVAIFGLGDQDTYPDSFADGVGSLYDALKELTNVVGSWPTNGYEFEESDAVRDNKFVGCVLDQDNQASLTDERLRKWTEMLKKEFV